MFDPIKQKREMLIETYQLPEKTIKRLSDTEAAILWVAKSRNKAKVNLKFLPEVLTLASKELITFSDFEDNLLVEDLCQIQT
jgi:hypothetical protein